MGRELHLNKSGFKITTLYDFSLIKIFMEIQAGAHLQRLIWNDGHLIK